MSRYENIFAVSLEAIIALSGLYVLCLVLFKYRLYNVYSVGIPVLTVTYGLMCIILYSEDDFLDFDHESSDRDD